MGFDGGKLVKGRKRFVVVDSLGLLLAIVVVAAGVSERTGAKDVLSKARSFSWRLIWIWADGGFTGQLIAWAWQVCRFTLAIVRKPKGQKGFHLLPRRWVVERTFGWLGNYRRLSKDYEYLTQTSEAFIYVAMIATMLNRRSHAT